MPSQNTLATTLRRLHIPGKPIVFTNVYDSMSARAVGALPGTKALATASYGVAGAAGVTDDDMDLETNLASVRGISKIAKEYGLPLTVDWQDGYGDRLEEGVRKLLDLGVVGINLEDCDKESQMMMDVEQAAERVKRVLETAKLHGVPDFVVNARSDALIHGGPVSDVINRGKAYLAAGATTVFVWGGSVRGGITKNEVAKLVEAFEGRLNVSLQLADGNLTIKELGKMGVARISIGPALQFAAMKTFGDEAEKLLATV